MGREIKRVPLDFDWPLDKIWQGFINPYNQQARRCPSCGGTGLNPATRQIEDDWYDSDGCGNRWHYVYGTAPNGSPAERPPWKVIGTTRRWSNKLTQDEVDALVDHGRLMDFTHTCTRGVGWKPKDPPYRPTAAEVNEWSQHGMGHDGINRWICVETRAKRLGVYGKCDHCQGSGELWSSETEHRLSEEWQATPPPTGDGWQLWETVSEGSPVSPVFATAAELAHWLASDKPDKLSRAQSYEAALKFVEAGWAPSMILTDGILKTGVEAAGEIDR
jgi:hypothetical protein